MSAPAYGQADIGSAEADFAPSTERYAQRFAGPTGAWLLSVQTAALRRLIAPWPGASVLDVGGGHGQAALPLLEDGHEVTVLASSSAALGRLGGHPDQRLRTTVGALDALPFADRSFDVVVSLRMMAHVADWRGFLVELSRVARAAVIVDFPIQGGVNMLEPLLFRVKRRIEGDTRRFATMTRHDVRAAFASEGFAVAGEIGQFVLPMVLHRTLKAPALSAGLERALGAIGLARAIGTPVLIGASRIGGMARGIAAG